MTVVTSEISEFRELEVQGWEWEAGKISQGLRAHGDAAEDVASVPTPTWGGSQLPLSPVPGDGIPSSGLHKHYTYIDHVWTCRHTHTHKIKMKIIFREPQVF